MKLVSQKSGHTPYVGFLYPEQAMALKKQNQREQTWETAIVDGQAKNMTDLNFNYDLKGKAAWKPVQVYDDGRKIFIRLPESAKRAEVPVLLVRQGRKDVLVNYRLNNNIFEVDGLFDQLVLVSGIGRGQERITINKGRNH